MVPAPILSPVAQGRKIFLPSQLPGIAAWYSADYGVLNSVGPDVPAADGQTVRRWLDRSGNGRHLEQGTLVNQPILSGVGVQFGVGNTQMVLTANFTVPYTFFICLSANSWAALRTAIGFPTSIGVASVVSVRQSTATPQYEIAPTTGLVSVTNGAVFTAWLRNGPSVAGEINGTALSGNARGNGEVHPQLYIGNDQLAQNRSFPGKIYEVIVAGAGAAAMAGTVKRYFAQRWGAAI